MEDLINHSPAAGGGSGPQEPVAAGDGRHARHVESLAQTPGFGRLRDEILSLAEPIDGMRVLDVGAGTGLLALAAATRAQPQHVTAVDLSPGVCRLLEQSARDLGLTNVSAVVADARSLPLPDDSIDLALSNYCLHHLDDAGKMVALGELARVLRPGGRLVFGDMMFRVGVRTGRDRRVVAHFALSMLRRGPAGVVRLARNVVKALLAPTEQPAGVQWWEQALRSSGFIDVSVRALEHEGGIASARLPDA